MLLIHPWLKFCINIHIPGALLQFNTLERQAYPTFLPLHLLLAKNMFIFSLIWYKYSAIILFARPSLTNTKSGRRSDDIHPYSEALPLIQEYTDFLHIADSQPSIVFFVVVGVVDYSARACRHDDGRFCTKTDGGESIVLFMKTLHLFSRTGPLDIGRGCLLL